MVGSRGKEVIEEEGLYEGKQNQRVVAWQSGKEKTFKE